jgi:glucosamine kinase
MNCFLGIDGGGTKTKCVLIDNDNNVLFESIGDASNPLSVGILKSAAILAEMIKGVFRSTEIERIDSIVIGLAGAGRKNQADEIKREILELLSIEKLDFNYLGVVSDAEATIAGAFEGKPGAILIAGTGSILFGKDRKGNFYRAGGFGKIIGDEGSGYSIARKGLNAVAKDLDGFEKKTLLTNTLEEEYHIATKEDLINRVYSQNFDVASMAKHVINCAEDGDPVCRKIIRDEVKELILQLELLKRKMKTKILQVALSGGLISSQNYYSKELVKKIISSSTGIRIKKILYPAEIGAALIAKKY